MAVKLRVTEIKHHALIKQFSTLQLLSEQTTIFSGAESLFPSFSLEIWQGQRNTGWKLRVIQSLLMLLKSCWSLIAILEYLNCSLRKLYVVKQIEGRCSYLSCTGIGTSLLKTCKSNLEVIVVALQTTGSVRCLTGKNVC